MTEKNHYLPVFYQKRWAVHPDRRVCCYSKPYNEVKALRRYPTQVGYEIDLYTVSGLDRDAAGCLERQFFKITDDQASKALDIIEKGRWITMDNRTRSGWTRFVNSLLFRTPGEVRTSFREVALHAAHAEREFERNYDTHRRPDDPPTFAEFKAKSLPNAAARAGIRFIQRIIDDPQVGSFFNKLAWTVVDLTGSYTLITCDRPIVMTNGMAYPDSHLALPIGPRQIFIASKDPKFVDKLPRHKSDVLAARINDRIASQARRFCIATDDTHLAFVAKRFGQRLPSSPMETIVMPSPEELDRWVKNYPMYDETAP
jgi:hypothetical protein